MLDTQQITKRTFSQQELASYEEAFLKELKESDDLESFPAGSTLLLGRNIVVLSIKGDFYFPALEVANDGSIYGDPFWGAMYSDTEFMDDYGQSYDLYDE